MNGQDVGISQQYYQQASDLATTGAQTEAPADEEGQWLPLGVFALTKSGQTSSNLTMQLAVNKQGIIRGNYTDTATDHTQLIQGSVDKQTQRVAFTIGTNTSNVVETGLYNLTKDEAPCVIHFGKDQRASPRHIFQELQSIYLTRHKPLRYFWCSFPFVDPIRRCSQWPLACESRVQVSL